MKLCDAKIRMQKTVNSNEELTVFIKQFIEFIFL